MFCDRQIPRDVAIAKIALTTICYTSYGQGRFSLITGVSWESHNLGSSVWTRMVWNVDVPGCGFVDILVIFNLFKMFYIFEK